MKRWSKEKDCTVVIGGKKPIIMEVVGEDGLKVSEYRDDGNDDIPYHQIHEVVKNDD